MPTTPYDAENLEEQNNQNLDLGYYKDEILMLFRSSENTSFPGCNDGCRKKCSKRKAEGTAKHDYGDNEDGYTGFSPLFSCGIGEGLLSVHGERLKTLLNQSVANLKEQVDDNVETVVAIHRLARCLKDAKQSSDLLLPSDEKIGELIYQKQNLPFSIISADIRKLAGTIGHPETHGQLRLDFQELLQKGGLPAETTLMKYSNDLFVKFTHLEQQLEEYLDTVVSNCREMTLIEKQQLRQRISNLPEKAMDRVLEIIHHGKLSDGDTCDLTHIDLDRENKVTLWRLYYYVETMRKVKRSNK